MEDPKLWGPLAALAGTWEGEEGVDVSFDHASGKANETRFRERITFEPLPPVRNGRQELYGLDYRTQAWPIGESDPFHAEVGYWLWDAESETVMRCFMVPRGSTVLAGGTAAADATTLRMQAELGSETFGVLSNPYLAGAARTVRYDLEVTLEGDSVFSYAEDTVIEFYGQPEAFLHTDRNRLLKV
jgi:hypothetical protein